MSLQLTPGSSSVGSGSQPIQGASWSATETVNIHVVSLSNLSIACHITVVRPILKICPSRVVLSPVTSEVCPSNV